jgi:hypothetical protein
MRTICLLIASWQSFEPIAASPAQIRRFSPSIGTEHPANLLDPSEILTEARSLYQSAFLTNFRVR